jgi:hypothetical protein
MTWVLIIIVLSAPRATEQPISVATVPGYASETECANAGSLLMDKYPHSRLDFRCITGPKK